MIQKKINLFLLFVMSLLVATTKPSHHDHYEILINNCKQFFATLSPTEQLIIKKKIMSINTLEKAHKDLLEKNAELRKNIESSMNRQYRDLTMMIGEGITIALLLTIIYKLFHQNKLYKEAAQEVPQAQKTVYLKKVVSKLHEIEKEIPKNSTISLLVNQIYNEQLAPEDALFKHNYSTFTKETNKYIDKLNSIQQKLEECHKFHHDNDTIKNCLKEISSMPKEPVQSFFKSQKAG